jgi:uncharacterized protein
MKRRIFLRSVAGLSLSQSLLFVALAEAHSDISSGNDQSRKTPVSKDTPYYGVFRETSMLAVSPEGWLKEMLTRQLNGLARHHSVSGYPYDTCLWAGKIAKSDHGTAWWPYEQAGYLVDGLERLGTVTRDPAVSAEARANIYYILSHPKPDGSLGPDDIGESNWPHAVVFRALLMEYEVTKDRAILDAMERHYLSRPSDYGEGRDVCNVEEMLSIYAVSGNPELLGKAQQTYGNFNRQKSATSLERLCDDKVIHEHGVTFNETAKLPALLYLHTGEQDMLDATIEAYRKIDRDHMLASGLHSAEEGTKGNSPDSYHETCNISDYTWSVGYLLMATGDSSWADHIEKAVFNAGLGSVTKDFKAHQYFSTPNQIVAAEGIETIYDEYRTSYRPGHKTECCSGNVHRFLPNYALRQWLVTPKGGIVAALYGPSKMAINIHGVPVTVHQETDYPFSETIQFTIRTPKPVAFPLHIRIPGWTTNANLIVDGKEWPGLCNPGSFETVFRTFRDGEVLTLNLPMPIRVRYWNGNGVSIERGPLVYALKIQENANPVRGFKTTPEFPAWDIRPASAWNYGLVLKGYDLAGQVQVNKRTVSGFPWDVGNSPIELQAPAMRIDDWLLPEKKNPKLPDNPRGSGQIELVTLVPYGSTRIRLTVFPLL